MIKLENGTPLTILAGRQRLKPSGGITAYFAGKLDDYTISVTLPPGSGEDIGIWSLLTVRFNMNGGSCLFHAQTVEVSGETLKLRITSDIMRVQRRGSIRLEILRGAKGFIRGSGAPFEGVVTDISAGGMSVRTNAPLSIGDKLNLEMPADQGNNSAKADCEVRWKVAMPEGSPFTYQIGCLFNFAHGVDKERLLKYIYRVQRNKLHKFEKIKAEGNDGAPK